MHSVIISFFITGALIGSLVALSASSLAGALVSLVFAFLGGSAIALFSKIAGDKLALAVAAIGSLSGGCIVGLFACIVLTENRVLTPPEFRHLDIEQKKVLRGADTDAMKFILRDYKQGTLSSTDAMRKLEEQLGRSN